MALFAACGDEPRTASRPTTIAADRVEAAAAPTIDPSLERALSAPRVARMMSSCRVTHPNHSTPPGEKPSPQFHGDHGLWTVLPSGGVVVGGPHELQRARASIPSGYGPTGFQSTAIIFPTEGCWQIHGSAAGARLSFVTLVVKAEPQ